MVLTKVGCDGIVPVTVFLALNWLPFVSTAHATTDIDAADDRLWATASVPTGVVCSDPPFIVYLMFVMLLASLDRKRHVRRIERGARHFRDGFAHGNVI